MAKRRAAHLMDGYVAAPAHSRVHTAYLNKIKKIKQAMGLSHRQLAKRVGVSWAVWTKILNGYMPIREVQERIARVLLENITYENCKSLTYRKHWQRLHEAYGHVKWPRRAMRWPPNLWARMVTRSRELDIGTLTLVQIACERLLDNDRLLTSLKDAAKVVEKARVDQYLDENPFVTDLLRSDLEYVKQFVERRGATPKPTPADKAPQLQPTIAAGEVIEAEVEDGPCSRVFTPSHKREYEEI